MTTVADLRKALAGADGQDEVVIYADVTGEWVDMPPYFDKRAVVCGYFSVAGVWVESGIAAIVTGVEAAL